MAVLGAVFVPRLGRIPGPSQLTRLERKLERRDLGFFNAFGAGRIDDVGRFNRGLCRGRVLSFSSSATEGQLELKMPMQKVWELKLMCWRPL